MTSLHHEKHDVEHAQETGPEDVAARFEAAERDMLHPQDPAGRQDECRGGSGDRPGARIDEVIIVVRFRVSTRHRVGFPPLVSLKLTNAANRAAAQADRNT
jgi:hypothetical protein